MDDQGIYELNEFKILTNYYITNIFKVVCRPRRMIPNTVDALPVPVRVTASPTKIPSPGYYISGFSKRPFKLCVYFVKHQ